MNFIQSEFTKIPWEKLTELQTVIIAICLTAVLIASFLLYAFIKNHNFLKTTRKNDLKALEKWHGLIAQKENDSLKREKYHNQLVKDTVKNLEHIKGELRIIKTMIGEGRK